MEASKCNGCACYGCEQNSRIPGNWNLEIHPCTKCPNTNTGTCFTPECKYKK